MNYVEPIKKKNDIKKMYHVLQMKSDRDYLYLNWLYIQVCDLLTYYILKLKI